MKLLGKVTYPQSHKLKFRDSETCHKYLTHMSLMGVPGSVTFQPWYALASCSNFNFTLSENTLEKLSFVCVLLKRTPEHGYHWGLHLINKGRFRNEIWGMRARKGSDFPWKCHKHEKCNVGVIFPPPPFGQLELGGVEPWPHILLRQKKIKNHQDSWWDRFQQFKAEMMQNISSFRFQGSWLMAITTSQRNLLSTSHLALQHLAWGGGTTHLYFHWKVKILV